MKDKDKTKRQLINELVKLRQTISKLKKEKQAGNLLKDSEIRYRELFNNISSGVAIYEVKNNGSDFIFKDFNKAGERLDNESKENLIGKSVFEVRPGIKKFGLLEVFKRVWKTGISEHFPISLYKDNRIAAWYENFVYKLPSEEIVAVFDNVTEQKRTEQALKRSEQELKDIVYMASHDLQSPIVSISGYVDMILNQYSHQLDEKGIYALQRLKVNTENLHKLVSSMLDLSRLNTMQNPFHKFEPTAVVKNIISDLELKINKAQADIIVQPMPPIYGDEQRLTSVLRNLLINAINYGGKHICVGYKNNAYFVQDDGIGLAAKHLKKIFQPGERLKKIDIEGVGMGLTFCKKAISLHNGTIWAESSGEGKGSVFYFKINRIA